MNNNFAVERKNDLLALIEDVDITFTMYKNAEQKYNAITTVLENCGLPTKIYPQGSFALGTFIKPKKAKRKGEYDLDVVCEVDYDKSLMTPSKLYEKIKQLLSDSGIYGDKLDFYDECITITYSECDGFSFSIDIVPAVPEDSFDIEKMKTMSNEPDLCDTAIAISKAKNISEWGRSNPKGYRKWFDGINSKFLKYGKHTNRSKVFEQTKHIYDSVEKIPSNLTRTPLQRVIQILKLHRNNYFENSSVKQFKVNTVIITTLVAKIASDAPEYYDTFELLSYVLNELKNYSQLINNHTQFKQIFPQRDLISFDGRIWRINNPANPLDNLADSWQGNVRYPQCFFNWVDAVINDFEKLTDGQDSEVAVNFVNWFGESVVSKRGYDKKYNIKKPAPIEPVSQNKPWRSYE